jgi:beta-glucanase (GH16 family)
MQKYGDFVVRINTVGQPVSGAMVTVHKLDGTVATLYANNNALPTPENNPFYADSSGYFQFYARNGRYNITISSPEITTYVVEDVLLFDPVEFTAGGTVLTPATTSTLGGIIVGENLTIDQFGVLNAEEGGGVGSYTLPTATASVLGGVKIGSGVNITNGIISVPPGSIVPATASTLGGIKVGSGLVITADGTLSVGSIQPQPTDLYPMGAGTNWELTFTDEFDSTALDTGKWSNRTARYTTGGYDYDDLAGVDNWAIEDSKLKIWPMKSAAYDNEVFQRMFYTRNKWTQTFGFFEARLKMPWGKGCWPAFWLHSYGVPGDTNRRPEIDIMEAYTGDVGGYWATTAMKARMIGNTVHRTLGSTVAQNNVDITEAGIPGSTFSDAFHVYGVHWERGKATFYIDGNIHTTITWLSPDTYLCHPMYIACNLSFSSGGGNAVVYGTGDPSPTNQVLSMGKTYGYEIDYIRAWRSL